MARGYSRSRSRSQRHQNPLAEDILATGPLRQRSKKRKAKEDDDENSYVDSRSSHKILRIGQELANEDQEETKVEKSNPAFNFESRNGDGSDHDQDEGFDDEEAWGDDVEEEIEEIVCIEDGCFLRTVKLIPSPTGNGSQ